MPGWNTSDRRTRLPNDWPKTRKRILRRDKNQCQQCGAPATDVDHIAAGDNNDESNLVALCRDCHKAKSSAEGGRSVHRGKRIKEPKPWRKTAKHPGMR